MNSDAVTLHHLREGLTRAGAVDEIAVATLQCVPALADVTRVGLALTMVGGRQLRFLTSDKERLEPSPAWCLVDAYDHLPLNDAVRTGDPVVLESQSSLRRSYPDFAANQDAVAVQSVMAIPLMSRDGCLGGLLAYIRRPLGDHDDALRWALTEVVGWVTEALLAARETQPADLDPQGVVAMSPGGPDDAFAPVASRHLPDDATAPATARRFLREALEEWGAGPDVVDSALLCTSEIVTNVVMHAQRRSVITAQRQEGQIIVRVDQPATGTVPVIEPVLPDDDPLVVAGRGLALVDVLATRWGTETSPANVRVWFELELDL